MAIEALLKINSAADLAGLGAAFNGIVKLGGAIKDSIQEMEDFSKAWSKVEGNVLLADQAANGLIDTLVLVENRNKLSQAGLKITDKQFAAVAKSAAAYAQATGEDATKAMERLTKSLISGSSRGLRPFGIDIKEGGKAADNFAKSVKLLEDRSNDLNVELESTSDYMFSIKNNFDTLTGLMYTSLVGDDGVFSVFKDILEDTNKELGDFVGWFAAMNELAPDLVGPLEVIAGAWNEVTIAIEGAIQKAGNFVSRGYEWALRKMGQGGVADMLEEQRGGQGSSPDMLPETKTERKQRKKLDLAAKIAEIRNRLKITGKTAADRTGRLKKPGRPQRPGEEEKPNRPEEDNREEDNRAEELAKKEAEARRARREAEMHLLRNEIDELQFEITNIDLPGFKADPDTEKKLRAMDREPDTIEKLQAQLELTKAIRLEKSMAYQESITFAGQFKDTWAQATETMSAGAMAAEGAFTALKSAWHASVMAVVTGEQTIGQAVAAILREKGLAIAAEAGFNAMLELGKAIAAAASRQYAKATAHMAAMGQFMATAAVAGAAAGVGFSVGGIGGEKRKHAPGSTHFGNDRPATAGGTSGGGNTNVNITLSGGAEGIFEVVTDQNERERRSGRSSFASA